MLKNKKMTIQDTEVAVKRHGEEFYISLTNMLDAKKEEVYISNWLRNRNVIEFLGVWEKVHNPKFNSIEFDRIKSQVGLNKFILSVKEWVESTNAIGLISSAGRYGGTYAHEDIAFEFGMWISPEFKVYLIKEFQRLKIAEQKQIEWTAKRELAKVNFHIHTGAIKENLLVPTLTDIQKKFVYADETDMLNVVLFGLTAKQWREQNSDKDGNMRDYTDIHRLLVLSNMESYNAIMINDKLPQAERMERLSQMAKQQLNLLVQVENRLYLPKP